MKEIKVIGFDLDHTLYPKSEEINKAIQDYICQKVAIIKGWSFNKARAEWDLAYAELHTGGKALKKLGIITDKDLVQEALENADIYPFLQANSDISDFLIVLGKKYSIDLITGSILSVTQKKLNKLQIPFDLFNNIIAGDFSKIEGTAFTEWLNLYPEFNPSNFLYVGDKYATDVEAPAKFGISGVLVSEKTEYSCPTISDVTQLLSVIDHL